jgi:hypothetical protein
MSSCKNRFKSVTDILSCTGQLALIEHQWFNVAAVLAPYKKKLHKTKRSDNLLIGSSGIMWAMVPITPKQKQVFSLEAHFHELAPERGGWTKRNQTSLSFESGSNAHDAPNFVDQWHVQERATRPTQHVRLICAKPWHNEGD